MDPVVLFFIFGFFAGLVKSDLKLDSSITDLLTVLLLLTIGLKGGIKLHDQSFLALWPQILAVLFLGFIIPIIAYPLLTKVGRMNRVDSASMAAHYGSVSVGTFAVCMAFLNHHGISYEPYVSLFVIILEVPAIIIGLIIAKSGKEISSFPSLLGETLRSKAIVLLMGGLVIGWIAGEQRMEPYTPFFFKLFYGVLALFLMDMGRVVSEQFRVVKRYGVFIFGFGIIMPFISGMIAMSLGWLVGLSLGGTVVLTILGASASYIAVPAAMRVSLPEANLSLSLGSSLGVTFPFNVMVGIPMFFYITQSLFSFSG